MTPVPRAHAYERLAELVVALSGAKDTAAREATSEALSRNGDAGDNLINVAEAIATLRAESVPERGTDIS